ITWWGSRASGVALVPREGWHGGLTQPRSHLDGLQSVALTHGAMLHERQDAGRRGDGQPAWIGGLAQTGDGGGFAGGILEEDAMLRAGPDGVGLEQPRSLHFEEQAAWLALTGDDRLQK